jgi:hypothetical protein
VLLLSSCQGTVVIGTFLALRGGAEAALPAPELLHTIVRPARALLASAGCGALAGCAGLPAQVPATPDACRPWQAGGRFGLRAAAGPADQPLFDGGGAHRRARSAVARPHRA